MKVVIDYEATTDKETIINLTHHSFFNLTGAGNGDILNHELTLYAHSFTPVDAGLIPTGELRNVKGTPFDFLEAHKIGERIDQADEQLKFGKGYDHNWELDKKENELTISAKVTEPHSGRNMEDWTTEPGLQFYSGIFFIGQDIGKQNKRYPLSVSILFGDAAFPGFPEPF